MADRQPRPSSRRPFITIFRPNGPWFPPLTPLRAAVGYEGRMLRGEMIGLRALQDADIEIFETELMNDVMTRVRSDSRPWRPVAPGSADSPYRSPVDPATIVRFSVVELVTGELAGEAVMFAIDQHNRNAHIGLTLRPAFRGRHLGTDLVRVLCRYGFEIRGLLAVLRRGLLCAVCDGLL